MATLLRIALWSLHLTVGYAADLDLRAPDLRSLHVQSLRQVVTSADSDETEAVTIAGAPSQLEEEPDTHPSLGAVASLYWAARHPAQAWRVFLPIQLDGDESSADITANCAVFAAVPSGPVACR
jgi:hypothetical protein